MELLPSILVVCGYVFLCRTGMSLLDPSPRRDLCFLATNLIAIFLIFCWLPRSLEFSGSAAAITFVAYLTLIAVHHQLLMRFARHPGRRAAIPVFAPLLALVLLRYVPDAANPWWQFCSRILGDEHVIASGMYWVGLSYMTFRTSYAALELGRGSCAPPSLFEYLSFSFFLPTLSVGPISSLERFQESFRAERSTSIPLAPGLSRLTWGAVKFTVLASVAEQLALHSLLADGHTHAALDVAVGCVAYFVYLYLNFSGFCDIAIGLAALIGISVQENFSAPFSSASIQEFWNRWHITLGQYVRDVLFTPMSKSLMRYFGPQRATTAIAIASLVTFVLIGVWHGVGWNFALFGAAHGIALAIGHAYAEAMRRKFGKAYLRFRKTWWYRRPAQALTFAYVSASFLFFALDVEQLRTLGERIE